MVDNVLHDWFYEMLLMSNVLSTYLPALRNAPRMDLVVTADCQSSHGPNGSVGI